MKKILLVALALTLGVSAYAQFESAKGNAPKGGAKSTPTWYQIQQDVTGVNFLDNTQTISTADIRNAGKCMVIDYSATWCSWCWVMHTNGILEAIHNQLGDNVEVIWVESDPSTTDPAELTGTGQTQGDWTNGGNVPYPIINDEGFNNLIGNSNISGYPTVVFVSPNGYWCDLYGNEDWQFGPYDSTLAVIKVSALLNAYPQAGVAPVISINGPSTAINGSTVTFTANIVSVDSITDITWTATGATTTSGNTATFTTSWTTDGNYTVTLSVTNTTGTTTETINVNVFSWNWGNTMSYGSNFNDANATAGFRFNSGSTSTWAAMYPAQFMSGRQYLKSVSFYAVGTMNYTLDVYQGGDNAPGTKIYSRTVKGQGEGWQTMNCSGAVQLDQTKNLWISLTAPHAAGYVMSLYMNDAADNYAFCGDPNGCWANAGGSWTTMSDMGYEVTWAIKATTGNEPNAGISTLGNVELNVYPNPTTGIVNIDAEDVVNVEVMDMTGRTVMTANGSTVDMSALNNGVYMLRVNTVNGSSLQKIVKK
ncbi:MAG: T9SS type A sorting domain-containing protein [Bacteroidales bacterium]|nr:T9SS type A sorting domain-containing protein [Bacteroidales bacterium]